MTALLLPLLLAPLPALADDEPPAPPVEIEADVRIDGLDIQLESGKGQLRIQVDGQELVIEGDQARGELQLGELSIKAEGDRLKITDDKGGEGVIELSRDDGEDP